ncbi:MAG: choice-of-anchor B family protein [Proteobacteria bacterium]|nr:choice-of-anchor B family protein [Pseudomonadota bacterium]
MKTLVRVLSVLICLGWATLVSAHGPMFDDYYAFDESNNGQGMTPELQKKMGRSGVTAATTPCVGGSAAGFPCKNIDLQAFVAKANMGANTSSVKLNDIWGWTDPVNGKEIAIVGLTNGTAFVDVTDPVNPVFLGKLDSHVGRNSDWRDIKVYNDHAFIVADAQSGHGLQVFDLRQLRNISNPPVTLTETAHNASFGSAHNIAINEDTGYAYVVGSNRCSGGLHMIDISNPSNPTVAGCFSQDGYVHDTQCVLYKGPDTTYANREICVGYNEDTITIVDVTDKANPVQISRTGYSGQRYTHQGWFLDDKHEILIMNDEQDEQLRGVNTTSYIWDVSDLDNPVQLGNYVGPTGAVDHNLYTVENPGTATGALVVEANYRAGIRILTTADIGNGNLEEGGFFDVIPGSDSAQFSGTWSSYIYFASGNIVASDIGNGLFVLRPDWDAIAAGSPPPPPPPPPPGDCLYLATFESTADGWVKGSSTCSTGDFVRGTPSEQTASSVVTQPAGAPHGNGAWFTATNTAAGTNDVDGGTCETLSPVIDASGPDAASVTLSFFHGQRDGGDDAADGLIIDVLNNGSVAATLVDIGDVLTNATWSEATATVSNPGNIQVRVRATDGSSNGDILEAGIDQVLVCPANSPPPGECTVEEGFEGGANGWVNMPESTCTTGDYVAATPTEVVNGGVTTQPNGARTGSNAFFTATNSAAGTDDVDGGNCIANSPSFPVTDASTLTIGYFHGQRDAGGDASGDFFRLEVSTDGGSSFQTIASAGDVSQDAVWQTATTPIAAGSDVVVRIQCSDGSGSGDLVECGVDDLSICPQ